MEDLVFCPSCHLRNEKDAKYCSFCGASLDPFIRTALTTEDIDTKTEQLRIELDPSQLEKVPVGALGLFILDEEEPLILSKRTTDVILGRAYEGADDSIVDLTNFGAQQLGVSRQHASIAYKDNIYVIEDIGSTNGTWINNKRLKPHELSPLKNNDIVNLAWLFMTVGIHPDD